MLMIRWMTDILVLESPWPCAEVIVKVTAVLPSLIPKIDISLQFPILYLTSKNPLSFTECVTETN
jgi:hypothetical protein